MKRVGFFGGSFDPIHLGHLNLAIEMLEIHQLDEILFCPTNISPLKSQDPPKASAQHRRAMVELAIDPLPSFHLYSEELSQELPSFTVDTLRILQKQNPDVQYHLILGQDSLYRLQEWKEWETLLTLATPLVGVRQAPMASFSPQVAEVIKKGMTPTRTMDISSTEIRSRLQKKLYCGHLIPEKVETYIHKHKLYGI